MLSKQLDFVSCWRFLSTCVGTCLSRTVQRNRVVADSNGDTLAQIQVYESGGGCSFDVSPLARFQLSVLRAFDMIKNRTKYHKTIPLIGTRDLYLLPILSSHDFGLTFRD